MAKMNMSERFRLVEYLKSQLTTTPEGCFFNEPDVNDGTIAEKFGISRQTAQYYRQEVFGKLVNKPTLTGEEGEIVTLLRAMNISLQSIDASLKKLVN